MLRLKRYLPSTAGPAVIDAVLDALKVNTRVEALYIQNFEEGFFGARARRPRPAIRAQGHNNTSTRLAAAEIRADEQLDALADVLRLRRIWCVNVGENFRTTLPAARAPARSPPQ